MHHINVDLHPATPVRTSFWPDGATGPHPDPHFVPGTPTRPAAGVQATSSSWTTIRCEHVWIVPEVRPKRPLILLATSD